MPNNQKLKIEVLETKVLQNIPGASGIAYNGEYTYIIGDNSPYLFRLNSRLDKVTNEVIYSVENLDGESIPKKLKPDFEALELIRDNELVIFGSGSKSPQRDLLVRVFLKPTGEAGEIKTFDLSSFYSGLREMEVLQNAELNIEAVAFHGDLLYLFNRGKNMLFIFNYDWFIRHLEQGEEPPAIDVVQLRLPLLNNLHAGLSGATIDVHENLIITASVEDTDNAYDDGEVLGSFIGIVPLSQLRDEKAYRFIAIGAESEPFKVESVAVQEKPSLNEAVLLLTTDSDGEQSLLIKAKLSW